MIIKFNIFENNTKPDLREIGEYVRCKKDITSPFKDHHIFTKGEIYKIKHMWGDPERAIEEYGINEYMPVECVSDVELVGDDHDYHFFAVNMKNRRTLHPKFFDYFDLMEEESDAKRYNL